MRLLTTFIFVSVFNLSSAFAKDCDVQIKANEGTKKLNSILSCLKNEIQTLKAMKVGNSSFPKVVDQSLFSSDKKGVTVKKMAHTFPKCSRKGAEVICKLLLNNTSQKRIQYKVYLDRRESVAFSDQFTQDGINEGWFANWSKVYKDFEITFPANVTIPLTLKVIGTPKEAKFYQNFNIYIYMYDGNGDNYNLSFNQVPIQ